MWVDPFGPETLAFHGLADAGRFRINHIREFEEELSDVE